MPHQCLKCGEIYEDGSKYVLEGCPKCGGKFFLYTRNPLPEKARKKLLEKIESNELFEVEGKKLDEIIDEIRKRMQEAAEEASKQREKVESIEVKQMGEYEINLYRLLEDGSIIVQKEGTYFIYLPSLFSRKK